MRNLNSDINVETANSDLFFLPTIWWLDTLKRIENTTRKNAVDQRKKETDKNLTSG